MGKYKESKKRTITKALLLRLIVFSLITFFVIVVLGQGFTESIEFALLDIFIEIVVQYIYERVWMRISWGITIKEDNDPDKTYKVIERPKNIVKDIELGKIEEDIINIR